MDETVPPTEDERPRPSRRTLTLIVTPILALVALSFVGNAVHPTLVNEHPLWLIAAEPRNRYLLLVAAKVDFVPFVTVAVVRRLLSDPLFFLLGALYGDGAVRWVENQMGDSGSMVRRVERLFGRAAPVMVFLFPGPLVCVLAGATGMSLPLFAACNVLGTVSIVLALYSFADVPVVADTVQWITDFYARNGKVLIVASVSITTIWLLTQLRRGRTIQSIDGIEADLTRPGRGSDLATENDES